MTGLSPRRFLGLTQPVAVRVVDCPAGNAYKISVTGISSLCFRPPKHGGELATSGGFSPLWCLFFTRSKGGCTVFLGRSPVVKVFFILRRRRHHNPHGLKGRVKLSNLRANRRVKPRPEGPSILTPAGRVNRVNKKRPNGRFLFYPIYGKSVFSCFFHHCFHRYTFESCDFFCHVDDIGRFVSFSSMGRRCEVGAVGFYEEAV